MEALIDTKHWPQHLQNKYTLATAVLMQAWLTEACRANGGDWSAYGLMECLAAYVTEEASQ